MADTPIATGGYSKEQVAYMLMERIAYVEKRALHGVNPTTADREWILQTFSQCLFTIHNPHIKGQE